MKLFRPIALPSRQMPRQEEASGPDLAAPAVGVRNGLGDRLFLLLLLLSLLAPLRLSPAFSLGALPSKDA